MLLSALLTAQPIWEAVCQTLQLREEKAQGWEGEAWRRCSNQLLVQEVHWEKHPKEFLPELPVSQSKANLPIQQEIPTSYLLLSCHTTAFIRFTGYSAQGTAVSAQLHEKHITKTTQYGEPCLPARLWFPLCHPGLSPLLRRLSAARRSHGLHPYVLLL